MINIVSSGVSSDMLDILQGQGLPVRRSLDVDIPEFPEDVTEIDDHELMILARKYMENFNFMRTQVACATLAETEAENAVNMEEARQLLLKTTGKSTEKAVMLKAAVLTDPVMVDLSGAHFRARAYRKLLETTMENLERYYSLTSRELTRRTSMARARSF